MGSAVATQRIAHVLQYGVLAYVLMVFSHQAPHFFPVQLGMVPGIAGALLLSGGLEEHAVQVVVAREELDLLVGGGDGVELQEGACQAVPIGAPLQLLSVLLLAQHA